METRLSPIVEEDIEWFYLVENLTPHQIVVLCSGVLTKQEVFRHLRKYIGPLRKAAFYEHYFQERLTLKEIADKYLLDVDDVQGMKEIWVG